MKRFLFLSIGVLVSGVLGLQLGQSTSAVSSSMELLESIFDTAGVSQTDTTDATELNNLASNEEAPFENLYLFMFQNVTKGPSEAALNELEERLKEKKKRDYTVDELRSIVEEGNLKPIIEKMNGVASDISSDPSYLDQQDERLAAQDSEYGSFKSSNDFGDTLGSFYDWYYTEYVKGDVLTKEDAQSSVLQKTVLDEYLYLLELYQNELSLQQDFRSLAYESIADEMFYNNDLSDSANIDILHDLDLAHQVLFGSNITYPDRSGSEDVSLSSEDDFANQLPEDSQMEELLVPSEPVVKLSSDTVSPYTCYDDEALHTALDSFYASDTGETQLDIPESTIVYPSLEDDTTAGQDAVSSDTSSTEDSTDTPQEQVDRALQNLDGFVTELSGKQGDWTRSLPCSDVFCITVELISDTDDPVVNNDYKETDNCILCHLSYINKRMGQTLDKSLVASKPTQNWFEDATCKEAGSQVSLDLNVYTIAMPIELDPGDDIDDAPSKSIEELKKTLVSIGALSKTGATQFNKTLKDLECESILNLYDAADTPVTLDTAQKGCVQAAVVVQNQVDEALAKMKFESKVSDGNTLYEQVASELSSMMLIFQNMTDGLKSTYVKDSAPLSELVAKPYCP